MSTDPSATLLDPSEDGPLETVRAAAWMGEVRSVVDRHLAIASRLSREGALLPAFQELVHASREIPMTARLAAALVSASLRAGTSTAARLLISAGVDDAEGDEHLDVVRQLARLARRSGDFDGAQEQLSSLLAERPEDRRARSVLNALLTRRGRWEELDASLEKATKEALRRGQRRGASRLALRRARLWAETLKDPARAALRAHQAAQYATQGHDHVATFALKALWLRILHRSEAAPRVLEEAGTEVLAAGQEVGQLDAARRLVDDLQARRGDQGRERRSQQRELVSIAQLAEDAGKHPEAAALLVAAVQAGPDPLAAQRLEAHLVRRGAWQELADFYRSEIERSTSQKDRARRLEQLAELLESELNDPLGAATAWAEVAAATGDPRAQAEHTRLTQEPAEPEPAPAPIPGPQRARALVSSAEAALVRGDEAKALVDFEAALSAHPEHPEAAAAVAELRASKKDVESLRRFERALATLELNAPRRGELFRRLARLCDDPFQDEQASTRAWTQVLAEWPDDAEAVDRLLAMARMRGDDVALEPLLTAALKREGKSLRARALRLERVMLLDRRGQAAAALSALEQAVRIDAAHREAWLALADRLTTLDRLEDAAQALEQAANATEDAQLRRQTWDRLSKFAHERLKSPERSVAYARRAVSTSRQSVAPRAVTVPPPAQRGLRLKRPPEDPARASFEQLASTLGVRPEPSPPSTSHARLAPHVTRQLSELLKEPLLVPKRGPSRPPPPLPPSITRADDDEEIEEEDEDEVTRELGTTDGLPAYVPSSEPIRARPIPIVEENPFDDEEITREMSPDVSALPPPVPSSPPRPAPVVTERRATAEIKVEPDVLGFQSTPSYGPSSARVLSAERHALFTRVRQDPLDVDGFKLLAEHFDTSNDADRSSLMLEIGRALEGDPHAAPRAPRLILNATDRAALRYSSLRGDPGELLGLIGEAVCRLNPARGRAAGTDEEFHLDAGKGARAVAEALLAAVRILGVRSPDVYLTDEPGPPIALVYAAGPRLVVGRPAAKKELSPAELRFYAGRAVFTLQPELLALRNLRREMLLKGLELAVQVAEGRAAAAETKLFRDTIPSTSWERFRTLGRSVGAKVDLGLLTEGARHSANRAGLVVCGGVAPALASLRAKKALPLEVSELVRFAASDRYLELRNRHLPRTETRP